MRRTAAAMFWLLVALPASAPAQDTSSAVLTGTVWDSLGARPVAGAEILVDGSPAATSGADGAFRVVAAPGRRVLTFRHPDLSVWAVLAKPVEVTLTAGGRSSIALATPSAATVVARSCQGRGAVVGGRVRDLLTLVPLSTASVDVRSVSAGGESRMSTVRADADGSYTACVPEGRIEEVRARMGGARGRPVGLGGERGPVHVHDLFIQVSEPARVRGLVRDGTSGMPLEDASVEVLGTRLRTLTRADGSFQFRGVPPGEVSVVVERLGYGRRVVDLSAQGGSSVEVTLDVFAEAIALDSMIVSVSGGSPTHANPAGRFDGLTLPQIEKLLPRTVGFDDLLRYANIPGLRVEEGVLLPGGSAIPGVCVETSRTSSMGGHRCEMVEVYYNDVRVLDAEHFLAALDPGSVDRFQVLSRTEAMLQYGGTPRAKNGVLLIFSRGR